MSLMPMPSLRYDMTEKSSRDGEKQVEQFVVLLTVAALHDLQQQHHHRHRSLCVFFLLVVDNVPLRPHHGFTGGEANRFIREVWGLQGAAYLVIALRYFSRIHSLGCRKLALDDLLMFFSIVC
jgi:hypothetical protein